MRARRPSAARASRAICSRKVVYSRPSASRRTNRVLPDCVLNALTSATVTSASGMDGVFRVRGAAKRTPSNDEQTPGRTVRVLRRRRSYGREVMVRRRWLIGQVALLGMLAVLALPSSGAAFAGIPIFLTANGPSPAVQTLTAGGYPIWVNQDTEPHTVTFADGRCSLELPPGSGFVGCPTGFYVGDYPYTVDGTIQASLVVAADWRIVTLRARSHKIHRGAVLTLHGRLAVGSGSPPVFEGPRMPVTVLARPDRNHPFHRIAVVTAKPLRSRDPAHAHSVWHLRVGPRTSTSYIVEANSQPAGGQYWQQASSSPFRVRVNH